VKTKRKVAGQNWKFDGSTITVHIPVTWKRRGGRKVIIAPDGGDVWFPTTRPDETLIRALVRAHRWKALLDAGSYRSAGELAEAEGVTRSFVNRLLRLTLLAPDIVEAVLDGRQPKCMMLEQLTGSMSSGWDEQREALYWAPAMPLGSASQGEGSLRRKRGAPVLDPFSDAAHVPVADAGV
jgi:hypothetical protein